MPDDRTISRNPEDAVATSGTASTPTPSKPARERARTLLASLAVVGAIAGGVGAVNRACIKPARRAWKASEDAATSILKGSDDAAAAAKSADGSLTSKDAMDAGLEAASQAKDLAKQDVSGRKGDATHPQGKEEP